MYSIFRSAFLGKPLSLKSSYNVIGAGISGLFTGYYLKKKQIPFKIYEKAIRAGGLLQTEKTPLGICEAAANGFVWCHEIGEMLENIGLRAIPSNKLSRSRYFFRNGRLTKFPLTFTETIAILAKALSAHPVQPKTASEFGNDYFGRSFTDRVLSPAMGGIYGAPAEELSFPAIFPTLAQKINNSPYLLKAGFSNTNTSIAQSKKSKTKGTHSFKGGLETFTNALANYLRDNIIYNTDVLSFADNNSEYILCLPAYQAARFFKGHPLADLLNDVKYSTMVTATFFFEPTQLPKLRQGFGCLIPRNEGLQTMGVLFNNYIFENRVADNNHISLTSIARINESPTPSEPQLISSLLDNLKVIFGLQGKPLAHWLKIHEKGIPLYSPSLYENRFKMDELLKKDFPNVHLFGNYTGRISIRGMCQEAAKAL